MFGQRQPHGVVEQLVGNCIAGNIYGQESCFAKFIARWLPRCFIVLGTVYQGRVVCRQSMVRIEWYRILDSLLMPPQQQPGIDSHTSRPRKEQTLNIDSREHFTREHFTLSRNYFLLSIDSICGWAITMLQKDIDKLARCGSCQVSPTRLSAIYILAARSLIWIRCKHASIPEVHLWPVRCNEIGKKSLFTWPLCQAAAWRLYSLNHDSLGLQYSRYR